AEAEKFYEAHTDEVFYDDRDLRVGEKFADAELIGIPYRVVISDKTLAEGMVEVTERASGETKKIRLDELANLE
ncbi:proline--tRNA ligase, partial [Candidatus Saccharibacteria bacterium]|nr:proline--tRNA ligase [Candidatus Saccharibacteria bacterium]